MAGANAKLFIAGLMALVVGLVPIFPNGWFILYTLPLVLGGVGLMAFAALRSVVALAGIEGSTATLMVGSAMIVQYFIVGAFQPGFVVYASSFGLAFSGFVACLTVIVPVLRALADAPRRERKIGHVYAWLT